MRTVFDPRGNRLLAALPAADWQCWQPQLQWVDLPAGRTLHEPGALERYLYFPVDAVVSLLGLTAAGQTAEYALVGCDGVVGVSLFMGDGTTPDQALVISGGEAYRLPAATVRSEFHRSAAVRTLLLRYTQSLMEQVSQIAVCNRHHTVDAQLCRWLLTCLDRVAGPELQMTQDLIAHMLGVRREGVTESALKLQRAGLIRYARGHIEVLDRDGLERRSCECYALLGHPCGQRHPALASA